MKDSTKLILASVISSALLLTLLIYWHQYQRPQSELRLDATEKIDGPLTAEEQRINNPVTTNDMNPTAVIKTNLGTVELELFTDLMPITAGNFITLAESGFYNGTKFHRVIDGFMIQGGDPNTKSPNESTWGMGGPEKNVQDEFVKSDLLTNTRGTIAMANTGQPNSGGSQWFINLVDNTGLDFDKQPLASKHPVFGRISKGMDIVDAIGKVETKERDIPVTPVVIESITIVRN